ncbi:MAG TPA: DUF6230 family protein [Streptosporangiaceae bacterium]
MSSDQGSDGGTQSDLAGSARRRAGRVRWRRFAAIFLPAAAVTGLLLGLTANGALASSFSISGQQFEVSANSLVGAGFQQFGTADQTATKNPGAIAVTESEIGSAKITNLCQSVVTSIPGLGDYTLRITAGTGSDAVQADSLIIDADQLSASQASFHNINIGQDASSLNAVPGVPLGQAGSFGQQASGVTITGLKQIAYATSAGTFTLPGFHLSLSHGDGDECFAPSASPAG